MNKFLYCWYFGFVMYVFVCHVVCVCFIVYLLYIYCICPSICPSILVIFFVNFISCSSVGLSWEKSISISASVAAILVFFWFWFPSVTSFGGFTQAFFCVVSVCVEWFCCLSVGLAGHVGVIDVCGPPQFAHFAGVVFSFI